LGQGSREAGGGQSRQVSLIIMMGNVRLCRRTRQVRQFPKRTRSGSTIHQLPLTPALSPRRGSHASRLSTNPSGLDCSTRGRRFSLSPRERAGVRGKGAFLLSSACACHQMALSHSSFQASGFAGGLEIGHFSSVAKG
jgi:hypothetical protein